MADMADQYAPQAAHKFSFGLWTVGNRGRDPFGEAVRPTIPPNDIVAMLAEIGAWGVNFHDNDLVPIDATPQERDKIVREFRQALKQHGIVVPMATVNLFYDPVFRDGALTANDAEVRAYALEKTKRAMDLGAEFGAKIFVLWGGREGAETDACRQPDVAIQRFRGAVNELCEYNISQKYGYKFALEAKPNEPRSHIYFPTTSAYLAFIPSLKHADMVGVNPEVAHEHMAGLNMHHAVAQAWEAGKLFHIDLNDQAPGKYDQDLRFGSENPKAMFFLVKFLEDRGYDGPRHFDAHAYRTEDCEGVKDFARGCMRTYLILKEKAKRWNADTEIQRIVKEIGAGANGNPKGKGKALAGKKFDRALMAAKRLPYERLDQLTMEILFGTR